MKKKLKIVLIIFAVIIALLVILACLVISAPKSFPYTVADAETDSLLASEIADMISDSVVDENGDIPEIAEITIPPENVNALLRIAAYRLNLELKDDGIECALGWENAAVKAAASCPLPLSMAVVFRGSAAPAIENGVMHIPVSGLKAGLLPLPGSLLARDITEKDIKDDKLKMAFDAVHHLSVSPDGGVKLGVYPAKISNLIRILVTEE